MTSSTARLRSELWNALAAPWNWPLTRRAASSSATSRRAQHVAERRARRQAERDRHRRQLAVVVDGLRPDLSGVERVGAACRAAPTGRCCAPVAPLEVEQRQRASGSAWNSRRQLEQHLVFVDRRVNRRDPARAVGVVERVLDLVGGDAERRRLVAIDVDVDLRARDLRGRWSDPRGRARPRAPFFSLRGRRVQRSLDPATASSTDTGSC